MTTTPAENKPFTVIGFWDDSDTAIPVGVVNGEQNVYGGEGISEGGPWATFVEASTPEEAEELAVDAMHAEQAARWAGDEAEDNERSNKVFEFEHNGQDYDVDFDGDTYSVYDRTENAHMTDFIYNGDEEAHDNIEEAAIEALEALSL